MAERGRARGRRGGGRAQSSSPRRPQRARREDRRSRLRRGLTATRASGAAKVLGMSTTRRAAVVAIVVCALAFTIAVPLRTYLSQRADVAAEEARQAELEQQVAELEARKAELSDPAQVEAEARRRLRYVMPGETPYMVQLPEDKQSEQRPEGDESAPAQGLAWYEMLWDSVTKGE
ncbi:septum formation initiator [Prauserella sp. PE36]|uniref:Septum formation initiator family protein n=1 Tax=Prauserella endophytica TaxID=1592324 RepID=A0ABY2RWE4_9PSEU|nr:MULTISPECIES: septum formation initiator family protein [Prauserella]PXY26522.1 septum formation initiator [Prauserella coralliicola]RBM10638.1 septum formation initiator [Prauserella sp. PE36]TKG61992.1 septum formation initiator family protein [Prauserella endophytica]